MFVVIDGFKFVVRNFAGDSRSEGLCPTGDPKDIRFVLRVFGGDCLSEGLCRNGELFLEFESGILA